MNVINYGQVLMKTYNTITLIQQFDQAIINIVNHIELLGIEFHENPSRFTHTATGRNIIRTPRNGWINVVHYPIQFL